MEQTLYARIRYNVLVPTLIHTSYFGHIPLPSSALFGHSWRRNKVEVQTVNMTATLLLYRHAHAYPPHGVICNVPLYLHSRADELHWATVAVDVTVMRTVVDRMYFIGSSDAVQIGVLTMVS